MDQLLLVQGTPSDSSAANLPSHFLFAISVPDQYNRITRTDHRIRTFVSRHPLPRLTTKCQLVFFDSIE